MSTTIMAATAPQLDSIFWPVKNVTVSDIMASTRKESSRCVDHIEYGTQRYANINDLPREVLHTIFETFNTSQGKRRGKLSLVLQQYIRDPQSVSYDKGYESDRTTMFLCLSVCKLWREIVLDVLFAKSYRCWSRQEKSRKHHGLIQFIRAAECFRPPEPDFKPLTIQDIHKRCRWQDDCACGDIEEQYQCPYRDLDD